MRHEVSFELTCFLVPAGYAVFLLFPVSIAVRLVLFVELIAFLREQALEHTFQHRGSTLDTWAHQVRG